MRQIHQLTPAKCKLFDNLYQHHEQHLLQEVGTEAASRWCRLAKTLTQIRTAAAKDTDGVANMTADECVDFQVAVFNAETEATTWSIADTDRIVNQQQREMYGITLNEQIGFSREFSISLVEFEAWWQAIAVHKLWKTIQQHVIHFRNPKTHHVRYISEWIWQMGSGDNFTNDIFEPLHISKVKEAYQSTNKVNYIW